MNEQGERGKRFLMNMPPSRILVDAVIENLEMPSNLADMWGFRLKFQIGKEEEDIRVWVEKPDESQNTRYSIQRSIHCHPHGQAEIGFAVHTNIAVRIHTNEVHRLLKELFYLWTRDNQADKRLRPLLQQNLRSLRKEDRHQWEASLVFATVYKYEVNPNDPEDASHKEVLRFMGTASTKADLRQVMLELPADCSTIEIHMQASGQIIGNAKYLVDHDIDPQTGKRAMLVVLGEFGVCASIHHLFSDLYNTDEEFERSVEFA
jgi:hypothetical protein